MSLLVNCARCGIQVQSGLITISGNARIKLTNSSTDCPKCGRNADYLDGTYDFVGGVLKAFTAPGITLAAIGTAKQIADEASNGRIDTEAAIGKLAAISADLAEAVRKSSKGQVSWELVVAVLALIYSIWSDLESDADAQALLAEERTQTEVSEKTLTELEKLSVVRQVGNSATSEQRKAPVSQSPAAKNRHERRKDAALSKRQDR